MWLLVAPAWADTIVVALDGTGDYAQVQDAIDVARAGDVVEIAPGTYRGALEVRSRHLTLRGRDGADATILDGAGVELLLAARGADVTIEGLTLQNAGGGGVATWDRTDLVLRDVILDGLGADDGYGAVYQDNGTAELEAVSVRAGAGADAWALHVAAGSLSVLDCTFEAGSAPEGAVHLGPNVVATFGSSRFEGNTGATAGAVVIEAGAKVTFDEVELVDNHGAAGAVHLAAGARLGVSGGRFVGGVGSVAGGAIRVAAGAELVLQRVELQDNGAPLGAGVALDEGARLDDLESTWVDAIDSAAVSATEATLTFVGSTFSGGDGAVDATGGAVELRDVTLGAGVRLRGGTLGARGVTADGVTTLFDLADTAAALDAVTASGGGALVLQAGGDVSVDTCTASGWAGAAFTVDGGAFSLRAGRFAGGAGPLVVASGAVVELARLRVVGSGGSGALVDLDAPAAGSTATNLELVATVADPVVALRDASGLRLAYSTFVGSAGAGVVVDGAPPDLTALAFAETGGAAVSGAPCAWCGFDGAAPADATDPAVGDPAFLRWSAAAPDDADLHLARSSVLVDAADPAAVDVDGSRADIGAWGGPDAGPFVDVDQDGATTLTDCDDADPLVHPGATEFWYDGTDQDCDGDDADQDGDGLPRAEDCDDLDAAVGECPGVPDTGDAPPAADGCGCAPGASPQAAAWLVVGLAWARRAGRARSR